MNSPKTPEKKPIVTYHFQSVAKVPGRPPEGPRERDQRRISRLQRLEVRGPAGCIHIKRRKVPGVSRWYLVTRRSHPSIEARKRGEQKANPAARAATTETSSCGNPSKLWM